MMELRELIVDVLGETSGLKATELAARVVAAVYQRADARMIQLDPEQVLGEFAALVASGDMIEIEYIVPRMPDRVKSFYLPKGSVVRAATEMEEVLR